MKKARRSHKNFLEVILLGVIFTAYRKTPGSEEILKTLEKDEEKTDFERIRCPLCSWRPTRSSRWFCADCGFPEYFFGGCGTMWNTFETRGVCPTCRHLWVWTSCLRCKGWSRHEEWYENIGK